MKKLVFILLFLLLITNVYAFSIRDKISSFSIKDVLTSFSIIDFFNKLFGIKENVVGINIESDTKVEKTRETPIVNQPISDSNVIEQPVTSPQQIEEPVEDSSGVVNIITQEPIVITQEDNINVPAPVLNGYLSVATLKESYSVNEIINLTDPPKEKGFFDKLIEGIKNVFKKDVKEEPIYKDVNQQLFVGEERFENVFIQRPKSKGYIIEFEEKSIVAKEKELEKKVENGLLTEAQKISLINTYKIEIENKHNLIKTSFRQKITNFDNKIEGEYSKTFNGIALDINNEELKTIKGLSEIKKVYFNYEVNTTLMDSVPLINADDVWNLGYTGEGITIAIIDTGIDYTHEDLGGCFGEGCKIITGYDFVNNDTDPMDDHGHGTHVAATAAGTAVGNGTLNGVAPNASLIAYKVLNQIGYGYESDIISAIERAVDPNQDGNFEDHYDIISLSLGHFGGTPNDPDAQAIDNAVDIGVIAVVAAGNFGSGYQTITCPGCARKAITVGATNKQDEIAYFSSRGPFIWGTQTLTKPDVTAPGVSICAAQSSQDTIWQLMMNLYGIDIHCLDTEHISISGTSMATPHVSGAAALIKQAHPNWNPDEIKYALRNTALDLNYDFLTQGQGRIDVLEAVQLENPPTIAYIEANKFYNSNQDILTLKVSAFGENFNQYELKYGYGLDPEEYITILESSEPIINENFTNFSLQGLERGYYTFKLEVYDNFDGVSVDKLAIFVDPFFQEGWPFNIGENGYVNSKLTIDDLDDDGNTEIIFGGISLEDGEILYKVYVLNHDGTIFEGWPKTDVGTTWLQSVADLNNDGYSEIVSIEQSYNYNFTFEDECREECINLCIETYLEEEELDYCEDRCNYCCFYNSINEGSKIYVLDKNGNTAPNWPMEFEKGPMEFENARLDFTPLINNLNNDNNEDIIIASNGYAYCNTTNITEIVGANIPVWDYIQYLPTIGLALDYNQNQLENWQGNLLSGYRHKPFTSGDINGDGNSELVRAGRYNMQYVFVGGDFFTLFDYLSVLNNDGTEYITSYNNPYYNLSWENPITYEEFGEGTFGPEGLYMISDIHAEPILADLNGDGNSEIILTLIRADYGSYAPGAIKVMVWNHDGTIFEGWPQVINETQLISILGYPPNYGGSLPDNSFPKISPASVGDLDNDGDLEIIASAGLTTAMLLFGTGTSNISIISAWHHNGELVDNFPVIIYNSFMNNFEDPIIADINDDNYNEILISSIYGRVHVIEHDGTLIQNFFDFPGFTFNTPSGIVSDLDNDGDIEVITVDASSIYVYDLESSYNEDKVEWPMFGYNAKHTSSYESSYVQPSQYTLTASPLQGVAPLTVSFNLQGDFPINSQFRWHFGDQIVTNLLTSMQHTYQNYGIYNAFVQILQNNQVIDISNNLIITVNSPSTFILIANQTSGVAPLSILFSINGDFIEGTQFMWYFGDTTQTTNSPSIVHVYQNEGNYNVYVRILQPNINPVFTNTVNINVLPKSKIQNTGSNVIQGYLLMKIQKNNNGIWQDYNIIVNDLQTQTLRTINGNSYLALDEIWNVNNVMINLVGNYRVYAALLNGNGNVIQTLQGNLGDVYEFSVNPSVIPINQNLNLTQ